MLVILSLLKLISDKSPKSNSFRSSNKAVVPFRALTDAFDDDDCVVLDEDDVSDAEGDNDDDLGDEEFGETPPPPQAPFWCCCCTCLSLPVFTFLDLPFNMLKSLVSIPSASSIALLPFFFFFSISSSLPRTSSLVPQKKLMWETVLWTRSLLPRSPVAEELMRRCLLTRFPEKDRDVADDDVSALSVILVISFWWNS